MHYEVQEMNHWMLRRSAVHALGHMHCVQLSYDSVTRIFLTSNFADSKGHPEHKSYFIETYLANSCDRDHSESPGKSTMRDRIAEVESGSHRGQTVPLSARTTLQKELFSCLWHCNRCLMTSHEVTGQERTNRLTHC